MVRGFDSGIDHPERWDARVVDLAEFVEDERGLAFDHPVHVDFLTAEEYTEATTAEAGDLDDDDREQLDVTAGQLRALGVASGPIDLFAAFNQTSDGGTLAFYDPRDQRVRVRGTEVTIGLQATLVHELTHALQDQHFGLEDLLVFGADSGASIAGRALAEGDAIRIEQTWVLALSEEDLAAYDAEHEQAVDASVASSPDVPEILTAGMQAPYLLGQAFIQYLVNADGNRGVDDAFGDPPSTEEHLFDPASYVLGEEADTPDLGLDEDEILEEDSFGSPSWFLVLAERLDPIVAFEATLGWAGDRYALFERDDRTCVRAVFVGDEDDDELQMGEALAAWAAAMPGGQAAAIEVDGHPALEACDPGEDIDLSGAGRIESALRMAALFGFLEADGAGMVEPEVGRCVGLTVLRETPYEDMVALDGTALGTREFQRRVIDAYSACGSGDR
jgi:hypothetical protein